MSYDLKIFEEDIDLDLYYKFKKLLFGATKRSYNRESASSGLLGYHEPQDGLHGFRYPGEVLECYRERGFDSDRCRRALATALTECTGLLDKSMFNNGQLGGFIEELRGMAVNDIYALCTALKWEEDVDRRMQLCSRAAAVQDNSNAAVLYVAAMTRDYDDSWSHYEERVAYMFLTHDINVFENMGVLDWLLREYAPEIAASRKSCTRVLKIFTKLKQHCISRDSKDFKYLRELGYTAQEIAYLNIRLSRCCGDDGVCSDIVGQNIALEGLRAFVTAEEAGCQQVLDVCGLCLERYEVLKRSVRGEKELAKVLADIRIGSVGMFMHLWQLKETGAVPAAWFCVPVLQEKWQQLSTITGREQYRHIFEYDMYRHLTDIEAYIRAYREETGSDYMADVLAKETSLCSANITVLAERQYIDMYRLVDACVAGGFKEGAEKTYVRHFITDAHKGAADYWDYIASTYDLETLHKLAGSRSFLMDRVANQGRMSDCGLADGEAAEERRIRVFEWACQEAYRTAPHEFVNWLVDTLLYCCGRSLPAEYMSSLCNSLVHAEDLSSCRKLQLMKACSPKEEYEKYEREQKEAEEKKKQQEELSAIAGWRDEMMQMIREDGVGDALVEIGGGDDSWEKGYMPAWFQLLQENIINAVFKEEQANRICQIICSAVEGNCLCVDFPTFKSIVDSMEVVPA